MFCWRTLGLHRLHPSNLKKILKCLQMWSLPLYAFIATLKRSLSSQLGRFDCHNVAPWKYEIETSLEERKRDVELLQKRWCTSRVQRKLNELHELNAVNCKWLIVQASRESPACTSSTRRTAKWAQPQPLARFRRVLISLDLSMMRTSLYICLNSFMILDVHSMLLLDTAMDCMIELKI